MINKNFLLILFLFITFFQNCSSQKKYVKPIHLKSALEYYSIAISYIEKGDYIKALSEMDSAILARPNFALFNFTKGQIFELKEQPDSAIHQYEAAINLKSHYPEAWNKLQHLYFLRKRYNDAIPMLLNLTAYFPDSLHYELLLAENYIYNNQPKLALARINYYENMGGKDIEAVRLRGISLYYTGDYQKSAELLSRYLLSHHQSFDANKIAGFAFCKLKQYEKGIVYLNNALSIKNDDIEIYISRARYFQWVNKLPIALEQLKFAEQLDPGNIDVQINLAKMEMLMGDTTAAQKRLLKTNELHTNCWDCYKYLGIIAQDTGLKEKAFEYFTIYRQNILIRDEEVEQRLKKLGNQ